MENLDLNAMGVVEMSVSDKVIVDGGDYVIDGLSISESAFRAWARANDVELVDVYWHS